MLMIMVKTVVKYLKYHILTALFVICAIELQAQQLILMDRETGTQIPDGSTITLYSSDLSIPMLTADFTIKNNTDKTLAVFLKKTINQISDSTMDFFCFYIKCWSYTDSTDMADTILSGAEDNNFATHVCHVRRNDSPPLVPGFTSITYTLYDHTTFPEPVETKVTVNYHLSALGIGESENKELVVFPNPAAKTLALNITEDFTPDNCKISVFNSLGKLALELQRNIENRRINIPVQNLPNGIYFGLLSQDSGESKQFRFIVHH
jgi:hypothetical protein